MTRLAEAVVLLLNRIVPMMPMHRQLAEAKSGAAANQRWAQEEMGRIYPVFEPHWDVAGKQVLDVGSGVGGKLIFCIRQGARSVTGIDVEPFSIGVAHDLAVAYRAEADASEAIRVLAADGARMPFPDEAFDAILSINVFEHLAHPLATLVECRRVLRTGGLFYLCFPPYYSPWGAHVEDWIHFPWPHLFFSERTLIRAAARLERELDVNARRVPPARVEWQSLTDRLPNLSRLTVGRFEDMVAATGWQPVLCALLPFGHHFLAGRGTLGRMLLWLLQLATRLPGLREVVTTKIVYVLRRTA